MRRPEKYEYPLSERFGDPWITTLDCVELIAVPGVDTKMVRKLIKYFHVKTLKWQGLLYVRLSDARALQDYIQHNTCYS
jgi:hypothetical protein